MPQILFRGKSYNSELEMTPEVRRAYQNSEEAKTPADKDDIPGDIKGIYERAAARIKEGSTNELPAADEFYQPSDESIYQPSSVIRPEDPATDPASGFLMNSMIINFVWLLLLVLFIYLVTQFLW